MLLSSISSIAFTRFSCNKISYAAPRILHTCKCVINDVVIVILQVKSMSIFYSNTPIEPHGISKYHYMPLLQLKTTGTYRVWGVGTRLSSVKRLGDRVAWLGHHLHYLRQSMGTEKKTLMR